MYRRFQDVPAEEGLEGLKKGRWLRWLMFTLGVAQPAIKLASFKGLPLTKAFGMMWLTSWIVIEVLALMASELDLGPLDNDTAQLLPRQHVSRMALEKIDRAKKWQGWILRILRWIAAGAHGFVGFWIPQDLILGAFNKAAPFRMLVHKAMLPGCGFVVAHGTDAMMNRILNRVSGQNLTWPFAIPDIRAAAIALSLVLVVALSSFTTPSDTSRDQTPFLWTAIIWYLGVYCSLLGYSKLMAHMSGIPRFRRIFRRLFYISVSDGDIPTSEDPEMSIIRMLWLFLHNLVFCILWYAYRYSSEGTENPGWTSVFG